VKNIELLGLGINDKILEFTRKRADERKRSLEHYIKALNKYFSSSNFEERNRGSRFPLKMPALLSVEELIDWKNKKDNYNNPEPLLSKIDVVKYIAENFSGDPESERKSKSVNREFLEELKKEYGFLFENNENKKPSFYEAIDAVKNSGGIAVVAHPGLSKGYKNGMIKEWEKDEDNWFSSSEKALTPLKFIEDLKKHGLDGVELYLYSGNDKPHADGQELINRYFSRLASKLGLITTLGSDCHGPKGSGPHMGKFGSDKIILEDIVDRYKCSKPKRVVPSK